LAAPLGALFALRFIQCHRSTVQIVQSFAARTLGLVGTRRDGEFFSTLALLFSMNRLDAHAFTLDLLALVGFGAILREGSARHQTEREQAVKSNQGCRNHVSDVSTMRRGLLM
jgi:hypothetical protein